MSADTVSGASSAPQNGEWIEYDYAVVRIVPHAHREAFENVGVILHARTEGFLKCRFRSDIERLAKRSPDIDRTQLMRALESFERMCSGGADGGAIGLLPPSERFHWLTAPRSAVVQASAVHGGRTQDLTAALGRIFESYGLDSNHSE